MSAAGCLAATPPRGQDPIDLHLTSVLLNPADKTPDRPDLDADSPDETVNLLAQWHGGDKQALAVLLQRDLPWIRRFVSTRLGAFMKSREQTEDVVQDAFVRALQYGPRFSTESRARFRALIARIIENQLRDRYDWHAAERRDAARNVALPADSVLYLDNPQQSAITRPSEHATEAERRSWVQLAIELLPAEDRRVILLREWEGLEFEEVGKHMGLSPDAARMRFHRALPRLAQKLQELRSGQVTPDD